MTVMAEKAFYTVSEVAEQAGVTTSRIRQICIEHGIGTHYGQYRLLTKEERDQILALPDRRRKSARVG